MYWNEFSQSTYAKPVDALSYTGLSFSYGADASKVNVPDWTACPGGAEVLGCQQQEMVTIKNPTGAPTGVAGLYVKTRWPYAELVIGDEMLETPPLYDLDFV